MRQTSRRILAAGQAALLSLCLGCPAKSAPGPVDGPTGPVGDGETGDKIDPRVESQVAAIAAAMNHYGPAIHTCWAMAAADDFRLDGQIMLRVELAAGGATKSVAIDKDEPGDAVLTECLVALWSEVRWPDAFAAGDSIRLPPMTFVAPDAQYVVASAHATSYPLISEGASGESHATILLDYKNTGNSAAAMSALTMAAGFKVPLHKHNGGELLYVLKGGGVLSSFGKKKVTLERGVAVLIPAGTPHAFEATAAEGTVALQLYAPGGNEQRYKGVDTGGTTVLAAGTKPSKADGSWVVKRHGDVATLPLPGGQISLLFDAETGPDVAASLAGMTLEPSAAVGSHRHESSTELLFVLEGGGTLTVAGQAREVGRFDAIQIPPGVDHSFANGDETTKVVQFYSPPGPELRFKSQ